LKVFGDGFDFRVSLSDGATSQPILPSILTPEPKNLHPVPLISQTQNLDDDLALGAAGFQEVVGPFHPRFREGEGALLVEDHLVFPFWVWIWVGVGI